jgi:cyanophycinase-like exopeptidase
MITLKPVYLLAGGRGDGGKSITQVMQSISHELGKPKPVIAYVGVAFGDNWAFYQMISGLLRKAIPCEIVRVIIAHKRASLEKARQAMLSADAIFMSGGDMDAGMQVLQEKNMVDFFHTLHQQGKLFFGVSAGSIMLASEWVRWRDPDDDSTAELFPCLGFAPVICDMHAEEDDWEELKAALLLKQDGASGYGIPSGSALKVNPDGSLEALGGAVVRYAVQERKVIRQPDLTPVK